MTMAVADTQMTMPLADLVPSVPQTLAHSNPTAVYLAGLAKRSRRAMATFRAAPLLWYVLVLSNTSLSLQAAIR